MIKLKNISQDDLVLNDLGEQLLHPNDQVELDGGRKEKAANSSQIVTLVSSEELAVIDNDDTQISDISQAIDVLKGFSQKQVYTLDNKMWIQETSRPIGTKTYFTSRGDDITNIRDVGNGEKMQIIHEIGDDDMQILFIDFNFKENKSYLHEGYITWEHANFDEICLGIVPNVTVYTSGSNTNFNLYGGYLIVPAAGDGTIQVATEDMKLVEVPISRDTGKRVTAYWDADYSTETHSFSNIRPNLTGTGQYNMFGTMVPLAKFVNKMLLLNDGFLRLQSADTEELCHGMRVVLSMTTNGEDHNWKAACTLTFHRERSV